MTEVTVGPTKNSLEIEKMLEDELKDLNLDADFIWTFASRNGKAAFISRVNYTGALDCIEPRESEK